MEFLKKHWKWIAVTGLLALAPTFAFAGDGVIEINEAAAAAGGVTSGDTPGFPVTISTSGSYRLTSNLTVSGSSDDAIEVAASGVTLDLNGFFISGSGSGTGRGIDAGIGSERVTVMNGTIEKMGADGVWLLGPGSQVRNVKVANCAGLGILARNQGLVLESVATGNGIGIEVGVGGIVRNSIAENNSGNGIQAGAACLVIDNSSTDNDGDGFSGSIGCRYHGNTARDNQEFGLQTGGASGYAQNVFTGNGMGDVTGPAKQTGGNICNNGSLCP